MRLQLWALRDAGRHVVDAFQSVLNGPKGFIFRLSLLLRSWRGFQGPYMYGSEDDSGYGSLEAAVRQTGTTRSCASTGADSVEQIYTWISACRLEDASSQNFLRLFSSLSSTICWNGASTSLKSGICKITNHHCQRDGFWHKQGNHLPGDNLLLQSSPDLSGGSLVGLKL